jgi:signal transduction histidine kinase
MLAFTLLVFGLLFYIISNRIQASLANTARLRAKTIQESERIQSEQKRFLYNLVASLSATLNYQRVLDTALDLSAAAMARSSPTADQIVNAVLLFAQKDNDDTCLKDGSARRFTPADLRIELTGRGGLLGRAIDSGEASLTSDLGKDSELNRVIALRACRSAYCIPLRNGLDTYGVMLFAHPDEAYFTEERRDVLDIVGHQAMVAIQNARLYRDLEQEKERITEVQEEARKKLARDLHDGPTQSVAALAMRVNYTRRLMERDLKAASDELLKVEDLARRTTQELRHMLFTLRPLVLESQGLTAALESMAEKMHEVFNQKVLISVDEQIVDQLEMNKQGIVFLIAEEAVNNARKHAKADNIWVRLKYLESEMAVLDIQDDGLGFDPAILSNNYEARGSLGMVNLRERAELMNGVLQVNSSPGGGTRIQVIFPLTEAALDRLHRRQ